MFLVLLCVSNSSIITYYCYYSELLLLLLLWTVPCMPDNRMRYFTPIYVTLRKIL